MKRYELLSGEAIDLSELSAKEQKHISEIEKLIEQSADYFKVERRAFAPLKEGKSFNAKMLHQLHESPRYKVLFDLVDRYHQKLFPTKPEH